MIVVRALIGFIKALIRIWDQEEWFYYTKTGLDPKLPAFQRWDIFTKQEDKEPETEAERIMPKKNFWVILRDKFMLTPEEVIFFTTDPDKVEALLEEYQSELRTRTSGASAGADCAPPSTRLSPVVATATLVPPSTVLAAARSLSSSSTVTPVPV